MTETPATLPSRSAAVGRFFRTHLPMSLVVAVLVVAIVFVAQDRWRRGAFFVGGAILLAAVLRLCVPTARVGLLAVRSRPFDIAAYAVLGGAIVTLAATISSLGVD
ncbi:hypothetical protein NRB56_55080 [Nocardia sp. RB56]|uniref:DUF3017 domain-containing protein n=2 Tax=Nocardia aurantia TaxID=2585199 RepID=A0A7K0DYH4_9NOCA|nr:hypothetical protein [Nocardia aurantia]